MPETVIFDHYEVLTRDDGSLYELGRGAMGITYKAFDTNLRMPVALKVINGDFLNSEVARQRFVREARSAAKLRHQHVASVFHLGMDGDAYFYAMEFIEGETVDALIKRHGPLKPKLALKIAAQVARALNAAQPHGLVHRDIKPANLMLVHDDGEVMVKVIDFGLAKSSVGGEEEAATLSVSGFVGTPHFASPEQLEEREIDVRSDIYSLGVTLWYMLAGQTPFSGSMAQVMSQHLSKPPPFERIERLPPPIATLLQRMLEKEPARRPQTPADLRREIEECLWQLASHVGNADGADDQEDFATVFEGAPEMLERARFRTGATVAERYRIIESLGESNTGRMFKAETLGVSRIVRLVVLHSELVDDRAAYTQIEREVERVAPVQHPNLLQVHALETEGEAAFLVLEWIEGFSLLDLLRVRRELSAEEVMRLLPQAADGVDHALGAGLKRLDLALHQVFLHFADPDVDKKQLLRDPLESWPPFILKLNPLGITRELSASETWAGGQTMVGGLSLQQGEAPDARARAIHALAAICYELLGGSLSPLAFGTPGSPQYTPLATLTEEGNHVLQRALDPARSFPTAYEFYQALNEIDAHETKSGIIPPLPLPGGSGEASAAQPPAAPQPVRPRIPVAFFSGVLTVAVIATIIYLISKDATEEELARTREDAVTYETGDSPPPTPEAPAMVVQPEPEPEAPPPPAPTRQEQAREAFKKAEQLEAEERWAEAIEAWIEVEQLYPEFGKSRYQLELLMARLMENETLVMTPELRDEAEQAAKLNVLPAMRFLGTMLRRTESETAMNWFKAAAAEGDLEALTQVGLMYSNGLPEKNLEEALAAFRAAADKGHASALVALADCYSRGLGVEQNAPRAVELLQQAVDQDDPRAMDLLGTFYYQGDGVEKDYSEAFRLYSRAAELDFYDSVGNLGVLYANGHGVPQNASKAVELFKKGAEAGNAACMYFYASSLEDGFGVGTNKLQAVTWYRKAAEAGNPAAADWCRKNAVPFTTR